MKISTEPQPCHCELPIAPGVSVEGETGKCYPLRLCPDKLRPAFRMVRRGPACEFGSGHWWGKEWWRWRPPAPTPLSSIPPRTVSGSGEKATAKEGRHDAQRAAR